jgi:hypothetical protein
MEKEIRKWGEKKKGGEAKGRRNEKEKSKRRE